MDNGRSASVRKDNVDAVPTTFVPPPTPLLKKIGFGTGASVYHFDRSPMNHAVRSPWALKKVNRQHTISRFQDRLENEAMILKELKHPNIVGFRGISKTEDGRKVLAMEECSDSLGDLIISYLESGKERFTSQEILKVIGGTAKALQYLHDEKGLLHGDIKSYNVLIKGHFDEIKLCDFGVSLKLESAKVDDFMGSGPWAPPEALTDGPLTDRVDIFSLGLVIWEMLTLKTPNVKEIADETTTSSLSEDDIDDVDDLEEHFGETPDFPEGLPPDYALVRELYEWTTRQKYDERPRARDLLRSLSENSFPLNSQPPEMIL